MDKPEFLTITKNLLMPRNRAWDTLLSCLDDSEIPHNKQTNCWKDVQHKIRQ